MEFYYQIKGKNANGDWCWPPLYSGRVDADNNKEARKLLEDEYGMKLPGGKLKKEADTQQMLLTIIEMRPYLRDRFDTKACKQCGKEYTINEKYLINAGGQQDFCSSDCTTDYKNSEAIEYNVNFDFNGIHEPVIYKITSKTTGKCYIGKTTQAFTLRWYQHFYQGCGTKFHAAIKELGLQDWTFEVIEIVQCSKMEIKDRILERESYWIKHYNSIENGYNSVISKIVNDEPENSIEFDLFKQAS